MMLYLPIATLKDLIWIFFRENTATQLYNRSFFLGFLGRFCISPKADETRDNTDDYIVCSLITDKHVNEEDRPWPLRYKDEDDEQMNMLEKGSELNKWEILKYSLCLTPIWFFTEYSSNLALANTSVASTTILTSTSGLFALFFGALFGQDSITSVKTIAVFISMAGVFLTTFGKTWAPDQILNASEERLHTITGDIYGLLSAMLYGLFTVLLKKYCGSEGNKADVQKLFGYIGLFTFICFWWLAWPLDLVGLEPKFELPNSSTREIVLVNGVVGRFVSDYIWAVSVVWTNPLVASLGMTLTIPLAMVADIVIHSRHYSLIYILGCIQVLAGFVLANISDKFTLDRNA
ncbi:thiamine-repressible mitochondrial transport protein THI74-like isoform X2 [Amaranthus tricolor]|uniref:thiamine-repressible mitochondrial transport protein THI74-like isoform X2 n=1 Tax=Amaranthus tricolor TaxID=29722 RepID=UPI00258EF667|nr:thiamine-repressible mitochondrial transport protein THI74-like isoform X2 [Amaranthus tricolor]